MSATKRQSRHPDSVCKNGSTRSLWKTQGYLIAVMTIGMTAAAHATNLHVTGALVGGACTLRTTNIMVDMGQIGERTFYTQPSHRTAGVPFDIVLQDCDLRIARDVMVTIRGTEDPRLPGLFMPSAPLGLAFGIETLSGQLLPVNHASAPLPLDAGETTLHLRGFIKAEPDAVNNRSIVVGPVDTSATFRLDYP